MSGALGCLQEFNGKLRVRVGKSFLLKLSLEGGDSFDESGGGGGGG